ncbi:hypothetical protein BGZ98_001517 [Dissophora globulifera]|nr:hypothetical protein BGZ98_001517 [Dissophora globulifera]
MNIAQAVASNDLASVQELCRSGHDPNQTFACSPRQSAYAVQPIMGHGAENFEPDDILYGVTPLNLAVLNGNEDIVRALIDAGADLNKKDGRGSYLGKEVVVRCLLEAGKVDVDATDRKGATALMYAARDRHMPVVKTLLRHGASPDLTDSNGWSSIQYGQMYPEIVQMFEETLRCKRPEVLHLLTPPESPQPRTTVSALNRSADGSNNAAIPHALSQSLVRYPLYYSKLSSLLSSLPSSQNLGSAAAAARGVGVGAGAGAGGNALQVDGAHHLQRTTHASLLEAIKLGDYMSLQSLLMAPPSLNDSTTGEGSSGSAGVALVNHHDPQTGLTPLHHALRTRPLPSMETVKILYQAGADMNAQSHYGRTALHHLCRFSLEHALAPLYDDDNSNNTNSAGTDGSSASTIFAGTSSSSATAVAEETRSSRKKNRNRTETNGSTASNHLTPNGKDLPGSSAASTTSSNDLSSTGVRHPNGANLESGAVQRASPEEIQRASKHLADCCQLLLRLGSLVNISDRNGNTPLHFAVEYGGILEVVSVLVREGADIEQRNTKGLKPLDVVRGEQSEEMRRILESGRTKSISNGSEVGLLSSNALVTTYHARDSILKPLNLPETLHEVDFQFNQVLQNLEHYQNHTSVSIETSLQYITDQILLGWSPDSQGANGLSQSQEEYNVDLVASLENLKYELESTYELLMITEEQYRDVITFYESELNDMTRQNLTVLTAYDSEKSKVTGLYGIYTRLIEQLEELEAENEGFKKELEEKKRRGLVSLGRLVHGAMGGEWSGSRNGTSITLAKRKAALMRKNNESNKITALDEEQLSKDADTKIDGPAPPSMVLMSQDTMASGGNSMQQQEDREHSILRPPSPSQTILSTESEPTLHTIAVLSQKVSLLEQELSSRTCDIRERDLLVGELTDLIEEQSRAFSGEIKSREERIDSLMDILCRAEGGEKVQTLVDELAVKVIVQEDELTKRKRIQSGIPSPNIGSSGNPSRQASGDWSFLLKVAGSTDTGEQDIVATLKQELELSKVQTSRLELANASLQERWHQAMKELEEVRVSEAANSDRQSAADGTEAGQSSSSSLTAVNPWITRVLVSTQPRQPQDEPLALTLDEDGNPLDDMPTLEEIELVFEILMANLAEISRDAEEADIRLQECNRAKEQIYQKCLYLDGLQRTLDENVEKIVSRPFKADTSQPNFMEEQLKLQNQLNQLMEQAESVTGLHKRLKQDLEDYKEEKQARLQELDHVRDLMRKIGPQELLRGLLVKLDGANPDDPAAQSRREVIAAAVAQGMELAAEMAAEEENKRGERVASHLWRNSCSVIDEGDMQDAIDSRLSTASIDYYTQSCSISDHKLFIQSLCSTLYALQMTTTHQIVSLKASLAESRASLVLADQELSNLNDHIAGLYDDVGTLRNQLQALQQELDRLIQHRKAEVEKVWEIVGEVRITGNGMSRGMDDDDEGSVSSANTHRNSSIQSLALVTSTRYSAALAASAVDAGSEIVAIPAEEGEGSHRGGVDAARESIPSRSLSISRAARASVLRRISSPPVLSENDEESMSTPASRASHEFSDQGSTSEMDRHALISAEMDKLRSVHLHLLSTITEYKKQITVVKDRNLKLVATLLDRERVRLWTADGQDEVISAIVGQHGHNNHSNTNNLANSSTSSLNVNGGGPSMSNLSTAAGAVPSHDTTHATNGRNSNSINGNLNASGSLASSLAPGLAAGAKKHHHLSLTAAEDGIKLLRCQLERIRQCEMTRFTEMGVGLMMNYTGLYPPGAESEALGVSVVSGGVKKNGDDGAGIGGLGDAGVDENRDATAKTFSKFEATLYSDLENRYGGNAF